MRKLKCVSGFKVSLFSGKCTKDSSISLNIGIYSDISLLMFYH